MRGTIIGKLYALVKNSPNEEVVGGSLNILAEFVSKSLINRNKFFCNSKDIFKILSQKVLSQKYKN
jgi:hypothetical protein